MDKGTQHNTRRDPASAQEDDTGVPGIELPGEPETDDGTVRVPKLDDELGSDIPAHSDSILSDQDHVFDVSSAFAGSPEAGMILRDTKKKKRSFLGTAKKAFDEWWRETEGSLKGIKLFQKKKRPTVAPGSRRKETVTQAGKMAKRVPRSDHTVVVEKLRTLKDDAEEVSGKPYILKDRPERSEPRGRWSHYAGEPPGEVAEAPEQQHHVSASPAVQANAVAPDVRERSEVPERLDNADKTLEKPPAATPTPETAREPAAAPVPQKERAPQESTPTPQAASRTVDAPAEDPVDEPAPAPKPTPEQAATPKWSFFKGAQKEEPEPEPEFIPSFEERERAQAYKMPTFEEVASKQSRTYRGDAVEEIAEKKLTAPKIAARERSRRPTATLKQTVETRSANQLLVAILIGLIILGGGSAAGYMLFRGGSETETGVPGIPAFMRVQETASVPMRNDPEALLGSLHDAAVNGATGLTHVYVALPGAEDGSAALGATTADIFAVIEPRAPDQFIRSLDARHMFGGYRQNDSHPFLILKSDTFDVAFSGMLAWEPYMADDLGMFLGTSGVSGSFTDTAVRNTNARVLDGARGQTQLVYAFVNRNTIVITTSTEALRVIEDAMR